MKYSKCWKKKHTNLETVSEKLSFRREGEIKTFSDKTWKFITSRPAFQEMLNEVLQREKENDVGQELRFP